MQNKNDDFGANAEKDSDKDLTEIVNKYLGKCPKFNGKPVVTNGKEFLSQLEKVGVKFIQSPNSENEIQNI